MTTDQPPAHSEGCDGTEILGRCAGCTWLREYLLDIEAWNRFVALFKNVPRWWWSGCGWG